MLTTVIIINYIFFMNDWVVKASESYENLKKFLDVHPVPQIW